MKNVAVALYLARVRSICGVYEDGASSIVSAMILGFGAGICQITSGQRY